MNLTANLQPPSFVAPLPSRASGEPTATPAVSKIESYGLHFFYEGNHALHDISLSIFSNRITSFIGPSGCGKSTLLCTVNRMYETAVIFRNPAQKETEDYITGRFG